MTAEQKVWLKINTQPETAVCHPLFHFRIHKMHSNEQQGAAPPYSKTLRSRHHHTFVLYVIWKCVRRVRLWKSVSHTHTHTHSKTKCIFITTYLFGRHRSCRDMGCKPPCWWWWYDICVREVSDDDLHLHWIKLYTIKSISHSHWALTGWFSRFQNEIKKMFFPCPTIQRSLCVNVFVCV